VGWDPASWNVGAHVGDVLSFGGPECEAECEEEVVVVAALGWRVGVVARVAGSDSIAQQFARERTGLVEAGSDTDSSLLEDEGGRVDEVAFGDAEGAALAADVGTTSDGDRVDVADIGVAFDLIDDGCSDAGGVDRCRVRLLRGAASFSTPSPLGPLCRRHLSQRPTGLSSSVLRQIKWRWIRDLPAIRRCGTASCCMMWQDRDSGRDFVEAEPAEHERAAGDGIPQNARRTSRLDGAASAWDRLRI